MKTNKQMKDKTLRNKIDTILVRAELSPNPYVGEDLVYDLVQESITQTRKDVIEEIEQDEELKEYLHNPRHVSIRNRLEDLLKHLQENE